MNEKLRDLEAINLLLTEQLNFIKAEKDNIDGKFGDISSALRGDLELAMQDKKEYSADLNIYCLQLERNLKKLQDDVVNYDKKLKSKEKLIGEKNVVISNLQSEVEDNSEKIGYKVLQEQLEAANNDITQLAEERNDLQLQILKVSETSTNLTLEIDVLRNDRNQLKLEADSQVEDILLNNAEEMQNITASFEESLQEREAQISELTQLLNERDEELYEMAQVQQKQLDAKISEVEDSYVGKISDLEKQLQDILTEKSSEIETRDTEKLDHEQLVKLEQDYSNLLKAKDEQLNYVNLQFTESQSKCSELGDTVKDKDENIGAINKSVKMLKNEVIALKELNKKLSEKQASEFQQTIMSKGKQLRELRDEFETVFDEKNHIIENMRASMKLSRNDLVQAQQKLRHSYEDIRNLEKTITDLETDKVQLEAKLSCLAENKTNLNAVLLKEQEANQESKAKIADILAENSKLMLACEELKSMMADSVSGGSLYNEQKRIEAVVDGSNEVNALQEELDLAKKENVEKDEAIENLDYHSTEMKNEIFELQNILKNVTTILDNVPDIHSNDETLGGLPKKIEQLVANWSSSQTYSNELSKKMHGMMEAKSSSDAACQSDDENIDALAKTYQERVNYLQSELMHTIDEKENIELIVREKYDDILENLRGDLSASNRGYKTLQEENFSLRNQLDVFRNVNQKDAFSPKKESKQTAAGRSLETSLSETTSMETSSPSASSDVMVTELKAANHKLKKICKKYKADLTTLKADLKSQQDELTRLQLQRDSSLDVSSKDKFKYEHEIKDLREEINTLVVEKEGWFYYLCLVHLFFNHQFILVGC